MDPKYFEAYIYIPPIIITGVIGSISSTVLGAFFQQSKKMKEDMFFGLFGAGITILFYVFLINKIGLWGAILGNFFSTSIIFLLLYNYAKRKCFFLPLNWKKIFGLSSVMIIIVLLFDFVLILTPVYLFLIVKIIVVGIISGLLYKSSREQLKLFGLLSKKASI